MQNGPFLCPLLFDPCTVALFGMMYSNQTTSCIRFYRALTSCIEEAHGRGIAEQVLERRMVSKRPINGYH